MSVTIGKSIGLTKTMIESNAIIAVLSASLLAPLVVPSINNAVNSVPMLRQHALAASAVPAVIIFGVSRKISNKILAAIVTGIAGAFVLTAVMPFAAPLLNRTRTA